MKIIQALLAKTPGLEVTVVAADDPWREGPELLAKADGVAVFVSQGAKWVQADPKRYAAFKELAKRGGGLSVLHWGMGSANQDDVAGFVDLFGGCHGGPNRKYKVIETEAKFPTPKHPVAAGLVDFKVKDEFYYTLWFPKTGTWQPIVNVAIDKEPHTVAWAWERPDAGRSFGFSGLHFHENWRMPEYRRLVAQGVLWTMKQTIPADGVPVQVGERIFDVPKN